MKKSNNQFTNMDFSQLEKEVTNWKSQNVFNDLDLVVFFQNKLKRKYEKSKCMGHDVYQKVEVDNAHLRIVEETYFVDDYECRSILESTRVVEDYSKDWQKYLIASLRITKEDLDKALYVEDVQSLKDLDTNMEKIKSQINAAEIELTLKKARLEKMENEKRQRRLRKSSYERKCKNTEVNNNNNNDDQLQA